MITSGYVGEIHQLETSSMSSTPPPPNMSATARGGENNYTPGLPLIATTAIPGVTCSSTTGNDATTCLSTDLSTPTLVNMPNTEVVVAGVCSFSSSAPTNTSITTETSPGTVPTNSSSMSSNDSKPVRDLKLEAALNGQEPTVRNLIMAAIGVMKNRKVRFKIDKLSEK